LLINQNKIPIGSVLSFVG